MQKEGTIFDCNHKSIIISSFFSGLPKCGSFAIRQIRFTQNREPDEKEQQLEYGPMAKDLACAFFPKQVKTTAHYNATVRYLCLWKNFVYDKGRYFNLNGGRIGSFTIVKSDTNVKTHV